MRCAGNRMLEVPFQFEHEWCNYDCWRHDFWLKTKHGFDNAPITAQHYTMALKWDAPSETNVTKKLKGALAEWAKSAQEAIWMGYQWTAMAKRVQTIYFTNCSWGHFITIIISMQHILNMGILGSDILIGSACIWPWGKQKSTLSLLIHIVIFISRVYVLLKSQERSWHIFWKEKHFITCQKWFAATVCLRTRGRSEITSNLYHEVEQNMLTRTWKN